MPTSKPRRPIILPDSVEPQTNHPSRPTTQQLRELRAILDRLERVVARYRWALDRLAAGDDPEAIAEEWARLVAAMEED
jgi:hypothetical protein